MTPRRRNIKSGRKTRGILIVLIAIVSGTTVAGTTVLDPVVPTPSTTATYSTAGETAETASTGDDIGITVTRVIDGDTIEGTDGAGEVLKVRILGIDTPETRAPGKPVQCWGPEATQFAKDTLLNQQARLVADPSQDSRDRYDRVLAHVVLISSGESYAVLAARAGAAKSYVYGQPVTGHEQIEAAEQDAKFMDYGLWGAPCWGSTDNPATVEIE